MGLLAAIARLLPPQFLELFARAPRPFTGAPPVYPGDFPDPFVLRDGDTFYAYATQAGDTNLQVLRSTDLLRWESLGDALPVLPPWAGRGWCWAPVVLPRGDAYVLYYTVREPVSGRQCISIGVAAQPQGPFEDTSTAPLIFQLERGGSIDPSPFVDDDGTPYLLWKSEENALGRDSSLWIQPLAADGRALAGAPTELLRHDRFWERPLVEAPAMLRDGARYFLFYSANWWESARYAVGYAVGDSPLGPFRKVTVKGPWMAAGGEAAGPGGQEFFTDAAGELRMAYHAWTPGVIGYGAGGARSLRISRVRFVDGRPVVES